MRRAGRRASIWPGHAAGIQEEHIADALIPRHMRVAVQQNVQCSRWTCGRDVDQSKADAISLQIELERPLHVAVAISPNDTKRRSDGADALEESWRANISEVPDLIHPCG